MDGLVSSLDAEGASAPPFVAQSDRLQLDDAQNSAVVGQPIQKHDTEEVEPAVSKQPSAEMPGPLKSKYTEPEPRTGSTASSSSSSSGPAQELKALRVLYLFAGIERKCDLKHFLEVMQAAWGCRLEMQEVDLLRDVCHDVQIDAFWDGLMAGLDAGSWDLLICTPPCNTHSRALNSWETSPGPRPV